METIEKNYNSANCNKTGMYFHVAVIVLLIAAIASSLWAWSQATKLETLKVWGQENFEKLEKIMKSDAYREQYSQSLDLMLQQLNDTQPDDSMALPNQEMSDEDVEALINQANSGEMVSDNDTQEEVVIPMIDVNETSGN